MTPTSLRGMRGKYSNYHYCIVRECKNTSIKTPGKLWIRVPTEINMRNAWLKLAGKNADSYLPETIIYFCEDHFNVHKEAQETRQQPQPGQSESPSKTSDELRTTQEPLSTGKLEQCRFCGEFGITCVPVSRMLYLSNNKTTLAVNEKIVQLDFNDVSLPNTACKECDRQLKEMYDFIQVVIDAQNNLIKIGALDTSEDNIENENTDELEMVVVKTEDDSDDNRNEVTGHEDDDKYIMKDDLPVDTAVFINETVPQKRKGNTKKETTKKPKKADTEIKSEIEDSEFNIDIKEEVIERKERNEDVNTGCSISDTGNDVKPNEVELATNALINEMRRGSEDGFSY